MVFKNLFGSVALAAAFCGSAHAMPEFPNLAPIAFASSYQVALGSDLTLTGQAADPNQVSGDYLTFSWDINNDGLFNEANGATYLLTALEMTNMHYQVGGMYSIGMRVTDSFGAKAFATQRVTVTAPLPPAANTVPEPGTLALSCFGLALAGLASRRRRGV